MWLQTDHDTWCQSYNVGCAKYSVPAEYTVSGTDQGNGRHCNCCRMEAFHWSVAEWRHRHRLGKRVKGETCCDSAVVHSHWGLRNLRDARLVSGRQERRRPHGESTRRPLYRWDKRHLRTLFVQSTNPKSRRVVRRVLRRPQTTDSNLRFRRTSRFFSILRDRIVCGLRDDSTRRKLLVTRKLDLKKAINVCKADERAAQQLRTMSKDEGERTTTTMTNERCDDDERKTKVNGRRRRWRCHIVALELYDWMWRVIQ